MGYFIECGCAGVSNEAVACIAPGEGLQPSSAKCLAGAGSYHLSLVRLSAKPKRREKAIT